MKNVPAPLAALWASKEPFFMADVVLIWSTLPAYYTAGGSVTVEPGSGAAGHLVVQNILGITHVTPFLKSGGANYFGGCTITAQGAGSGLTFSATIVNGVITKIVSKGTPTGYTNNEPLIFTPGSNPPGNAPCNQNNYGQPGPILLALTNVDMDLAILPDAQPASNCNFLGAYLARGIPSSLTPSGLPAGAIYCSSIPMDRTKLSCKVGLDVDKMAVTIYPRLNDTIFGGSINNAARGGTFDGSTVEVYRVFWSKFTKPAYGGGLVIFVGRMGDIDPIGRSKITFNVHSYSELFNLDFPTRVYQGFCDFQLYGPGCCVNRAAYTFEGAISASPAPTNTSFSVAFGSPDGYFTQGTFLFNSGKCAGESGTIKYWGGQICWVFTPLPAAPAPGDVVTLYAGCDHSYTTCQSKFNNLANFPQCPFIPIPQTMLPPIVQNSDDQKQ